MQGLFIASVLLVRTPIRWARVVLMFGAIAWLATVAALAVMATNGESPFTFLDT